MQRGGTDKQNYTEKAEQKYNGTDERQQKILYRRTESETNRKEN